MTFDLRPTYKPHDLLRQRQFLLTGLVFTSRTIHRINLRCLHLLFPKVEIIVVTNVHKTSSLDLNTAYHRIIFMIQKNSFKNSFKDFFCVFKIVMKIINRLCKTFFRNDIARNTTKYADFY